jgi:hypothetical protein
MDFYCRYSPHGRQTTEENIHWDRLRAPPIDTPPNVLHDSDCLDDLRPGDHIEIQWRKSKEFPYGVFLNQHASIYEIFTFNSTALFVASALIFLVKICVFFFFFFL